MKITIKGQDIIAGILLVGAFALRAIGINSLTEYIIIGIAVAYGIAVVPKPKRKGK